MLRYVTICLILGIPIPTSVGADPDAYIDDRSSPERVIESLYNAIDRNEYLRAWSYFRDGNASPFDEFRDGYADTASVKIKTGRVEYEGSAGKIHSSVPVALLATDQRGNTKVYAGCYRLTQIQPAIQEMPPFRPIQIDGGKLARVFTTFADAMGRCD